MAQLVKVKAPGLEYRHFFPAKNEKVELLKDERHLERDEQQRTTV